MITLMIFIINIKDHGNILLIKLRLYHAMTDKRKEIGCLS